MNRKQLVFFSGGSAFNITSSMLAKYTEDVTYIVTTFDSGGSTGILRSLSSMPAVGDIRKRMLALSDSTCNEYVYKLFSYRASQEPNFQEIDEIYTILYKEHVLWKGIPHNIASELGLYMDTFVETIALPFSFSELSIGNCLIVGAMFYHQSLYQAIQALTCILHVHGVVLPITEEDLHLVGITHDGKEYIGQKVITTEAQAPFVDFFLATVSQGTEPCYTPMRVSAPPYVLQALHNAHAICYPMGSFYSSILACLLVDGVGEAIAKASCPKIYIPNVGIDKEQGNMSVATCVNTLLHTVGAQQGNAFDYITHIIVDEDSSVYANGIERKQIPREIELVTIPELATTFGTAPEKIVDFFSSL